MPIKTSRFDVDILSQTLAEVIVRSKYGVATPEPFSGYVTANTKNEIITISGKGVIYGLVVYVQGTDIQRNDYLSYDIDGATYDDVSFEYFMLFNDVLVPGVLGWLGCYDEVNYRYSIHVGTGITFEQYSKLYYTETHGRTPLVFGIAYYALI